MYEPTSSTRRSVRRTLRRFRPYLLGMSVLSAVALWLTFQHKPGWYQPVVPTDDVIQRARREGTNLIDTISAHLVRNKRLKVTLREPEVNEWLAALPFAWPDAATAIPPEISQPAVRFTTEGVRVGGHATSSGWEVILGVTIRLEMIEDGDALLLSVHSIRAGSLPLPLTMIKPILRRATAGYGTTEAEREDNLASSRPSTDDLFKDRKSVV